MTQANENYATGENEYYDIHIEDLEGGATVPIVTSSQNEAIDIVYSVDHISEHFPAIANWNTSKGSRSTGSAKKRAVKKALPNLLANNLIARFKRVQVDPDEDQKIKLERQSTYDGLKRLTTTMSCPAKGNMGIFVRYRDIYPHFEDETLAYNDMRPTNHYNRQRNKSAPSGLVQPVIAGTPTDDDSDIVDEAIEAAQYVRKKHIMDKLAGVTDDFKVTQPRIKVMMHDKKKKQDKHRERGVSFGGDEHFDNAWGSNWNNTDEKKSTKFKSKVPGRYVFPKRSDFVYREQTKIEPANVDWVLKSVVDNKKVEKERESYKKGGVLNHGTDKKGITGKLCRNSYPVTEALHKHGTSETKIKAHPPKVGEIAIEKVWHRRSENFTTPLQMAQQDIHVELSDNMKSCIANMRKHQRISSSEKKQKKRDRNKDIVMQQKLKIMNRMMLMI